MNRRTVLATAAGVLTASAGCLSTASADESLPRTAQVNPPDESATLTEGETYSRTLTLPEVQGEATAHIHLLLTLRESNPTNAVGGVSVTITNANTGEALTTDDGVQSFAPGDSRLYTAVLADASGVPVEVTVEAGAGEDLSWRASYSATVAGE